MVLGGSRDVCRNMMLGGSRDVCRNMMLGGSRDVCRNMMLGGSRDVCRNADRPLGHTRGYGKVWLPENTAESPMVTAVKMLDSTTTDSALLNSHTHAPINRTQTTDNAWLPRGPPPRR